MKIAFICPVSLTVPRNNDGTVKGYDITCQRGWVKKYGPALMASLKTLQVLCAAGRIAGLPLPNLNNIGKGLNTFDEVNEQLIEYMGEDVIPNFKEIGDTLTGCMTIDADVSPDSDLKEIIRKSFIEVQQLAQNQNDPKFLMTGLVKVQWEGDVEYVLNEPDVKKKYEEGGIKKITDDPNPFIPILAQGLFEKKGKNKFGKEWSHRYLVLDRFGFLNSYNTEEDYNNDISKVKGKMKKIVNITDPNRSDCILKVKFYDDEVRKFKATTPVEKKKWIDAVSKLKDSATS
eukprot:CAMPEP_0197826178 /NCGR_PEP_ID=MMETSP1437-20131217/3166_1 /TAXON_ID=49252 ORGANISM="Eucampia antarctica, Strain CCMP1452" /NCGR_SAMPLE_ID=MMETSP1437 /ASSEMBLY_ACC=CAM_ASM_001096 /LENGTH=287 /DNA_ID=CAMNT_0043426499 /DNA_START=25 /DNA_END=888 /DNA_ORIENTATION=+